MDRRIIDLDGIDLDVGYDYEAAVPGDGYNYPDEAATATVSSIKLSGKEIIGWFTETFIIDNIESQILAEIEAGQHMGDERV
jgi:hypothetical protein